jgi:hypothetical protein
MSERDKAFEKWLNSHRRLSVMTNTPTDIAKELTTDILLLAKARDSLKQRTMVGANYRGVGMSDRDKAFEKWLNSQGPTTDIIEKLRDAFEAGATHQKQKDVETARNYETLGMNNVALCFHVAKAIEKSE